MYTVGSVPTVLLNYVKRTAYFLTWRRIIIHVFLRKTSNAILNVILMLLKCWSWKERAPSPWLGRTRLVSSTLETLWWSTDKNKGPSKNDGSLKWAVSIKPYPTRDSTRIARTFILTLQRYELYSKLPNISAEICITTRHFFFFWGLFIPKDMKGTANGIHYVMQKCNALLHFCHSRIIFCW